MTFADAMRRVLTARLALPAILLAVLAAVWINEWTHQRSSSFRQARADLFTARLQSMELLQLLTDAETSQRGFMITDREEYLEPYRAALAALPVKLEATLRFVGASGDADELRSAIEAKMGELETTITMHRSGRHDTAVELVRSGLGRESMERVRTALRSALDRAGVEDTVVARAVRTELELRRWALHTLTLLTALAAMAYARKLVSEVREREQERARLEAEVQARTADLRELAAHLQTVQERERARLSRELHDEIGGLLTAAKLDLTRLRSLRDPTELPARARQVGQRIDEIVAIKRRIIEGLRPSTLEHLGLRAALELLCREVGERLGTPVHTQIDDAELSDDAEITAYRVVQEALTNVQKYAGAQHVQVRLGVEQGRVELTVQDDGAGFDMRASRVNRHGLAGMRYRVEALGGTLRLDSAPGRGTRVSATLPAPQPDQAGTAADAAEAAGSTGAGARIS